MSILPLKPETSDISDIAVLPLQATRPVFDVRPATMDDFDELNRLWHQLDAYHHLQDPVHFPVIKLDEPARTEDYIECLINRHDQTLLVAQKRDGQPEQVTEAASSKLLGLASVFLQTLAPNAIFPARVLFELDNLVVDQNTRRMGVARALCNSACQWAKGHGAREMSLNVYDFNSPARAFYEAMGFLPSKMQMRRQLL
ncbi:GNAT family N-acetyltransferase [Cohaesibacter gelatinilyticus]|uniref:Ribosomal protein S18 acetylase RimI n=1 Tax=Cohaesibacter gelatinilyticus TaxID=372072 RepID=A0A285N9J6_9HYPH|nr:GNAT family N-acetyltransferase [Cohaesibacter gelatinilyticus]SNZ06162.1 Ribosomal protein S18 acetylase RimI [Cohaesibacter gelatinilyticus]